MIRNLPNLISLMRLLLVPATLWAMDEKEYGLAFGLFVTAGVSDALDGAIARAFHARSRLGSYLDPLADKVLLVSIYIMLGFADLLPHGLVFLVAFRDLFLVGGAVLLGLLDAEMPIEPLFISKVNTAAQIGLAGLVLARLGGLLGDWAVQADAWRLIPIMMAAVFVSTLASGLAYLLKYGRALAERGHKP